MPLYTHRTASDVTSLVVKLSELLPVKLSRMKENHANALGFKSYNALMAHVKKDFVIFELEYYLSDLSYILKNKHGTPIEPDRHSELLQILNAFLKENNPCPQAYRSLYQIDFKVLENKDRFRSRTLDYAGSPMEGLLSDKEYPLLSEYLFSKGIIESNTLDLQGIFSDETGCDRMPIDYSDDYLFRKNNILVVFSSKETYEDVECPSRQLSGYGSIFIRSNSDEDIEELNPSQFFTAHAVANEATFKIQIRDVYRHDINYVPKELNGNLTYKSCVEADLDEVRVADWDKSLEYLIDDEGLHIPLYGYDGAFFDEELSHGAGYCEVSFNHTEKLITISSPCFMRIFDYVGWEYAQDLSLIPTELMNTINQYPNLRDYRVCYRDNTDHLSYSAYPDQIVLLYDFAEALVKKKGFEVPTTDLYFSDNERYLECAKEYKAIRESLSNLEGTDGLIDLLKFAGVHSIAINYLVRNDDGIMVANSFAAYSKEGELITVFEIRSMRGYNDLFTSIIDSMNDALEGGAKVVMELEDYWGTYTPNNENPYQASVLQIAKPQT